MASAAAQRHSGARLRGQPLLFLGTVVLLWTAARVIHHLPDGSVAAVPDVTAQAGPSYRALVRTGARVRARGSPLGGTLAILGIAPAQAAPMTRGPPAATPAVPRVPAPDRPGFDIALAHQFLWMESLTASTGSSGRGRSPLVDGPLLIEPARTMPQVAGLGAASGVASAGPDKKWSIYGWSLLRQGSRAGALAPGAQYGGSQAGLIVRYAVGDPARALSFYVRAATALARDDDRTLAIGIAARPWGALPVDLAVERRFGLADGQRDRFAAMLVAGGGAALDHSRVCVEAFAQAGIVGWSEPQGFFDLQMLATRQVVTRDDRSVSVGGGVWAGGQQDIDSLGGKRWVHRVDAGPRAALALPVGDSQMTVALDWRQRIDGNAQPASGDAITVSTGF